VKAPRQKLSKGKTRVLTTEEAGDLLRSVEIGVVLGLRDRALIGVMVFTFPRISAACGLNVNDIFHQQRRLWVRLHEKGGKFHEMPCHHTTASSLRLGYDRRAKEAGITTQVCNHTFRGTGITAYLENGGTLEKARQMAAHASTRTTQLYDRREDRVTLDEVVKINIWG
jgi:integrase